MSQRDLSKLLRAELAALFVASLLAALFFFGQGLSKAALLFASVLLMLQPFVLYDYLRQRD